MKVYRATELDSTGPGESARRAVVESPRMRAALLRFAPRQVHPDHAHHGSDEVFHFVAGACTFRAGGETAVLTAGDVAVVPAGEYHGFTAHDEPVVLLAVCAPNTDDAVTLAGAERVKQQSHVRLLEPSGVLELARDLLCAAGATAANAVAVAGHLIESDMMGLHSHGLMRLPQYLAEIERGEIDPQAAPEVEERRGPIVRLDGRRAFGQVAAGAAVAEAAAAAGEHGIALAVVRRAAHAGRIGAYVQELAERGLLGIAFCSSPRSGHRVAPFGGVEGRLATNPIAYGLPAEPAPIVVDFSTSTVPEGVVRGLRDREEEAPPGVLQSAAGEPAFDPAVLYGDPPGTILPLGGERFGYKGTALALLVEAMATLLAGEGTDDPERFGNNLTVLALSVDAGFAGRTERLAQYIRSSRPRSAERPVLMPGDRERRRQEAASGVPVDEPTWRRLAELAERYALPPPRSSPPAPARD